MRYKRRSTKKIQELPSLFTEAEIYGEESEKNTTVLSDTVVDTSECPVLGDEFRAPKHKLRFISFGSGSSGNCSYVGTSDCGILIDAGVDNKRVMAELERNGIDPATIRGIFLTHDHGDHVRYAYALVRKQPSIRRSDGSISGWRLYATPRTIEGVLRRHNLSRRIRDYHTPIHKEHEYVFDDIKIVPFETSHDGADNMGYYIEMGDARLAICTDTGVITDRADFYLRRATSIMLESNYDDTMLANGSYPSYLKARIRSNVGHLDNVDAARYIVETFRPTLKHVFLCHLSEENNTPELAVQSMTEALRRAGIDLAASPSTAGGGSIYLTALPRYTPSDLYVL